MNKVDSLDFRCVVVKEYSYTSTPQILGDADNTMDLYLNDDRKEGCIIWDYLLDKESMDEVVIGLWFENDELIDYDGVFELPEQAMQLIKRNGFTIN